VCIRSPSVRDAKVARDEDAPFEHAHFRAAETALPASLEASGVIDAYVVCVGVECGQVFGLTSMPTFVGRLLSTASQPSGEGQCYDVEFVLEYRCGAAPDSNRVPS